MGDFLRFLSIIRRSIVNYFKKHSYCVSFEITYNCNAKCLHCHLGGEVEENRASADTYGAICRKLKPVVVQISGGEPLMHPELTNIIKAVRRINRAPLIIITTNGSLLSIDKYRELIQAGVDEFSLSLDYPDDRQDEFRRIPGLFSMIRGLMDGFNCNEKKAITLACVIQRYNYRDIISMAELARHWNVRISFSTYTWMRTKKKDFMLPKEELPEFQRMIRRVIAYKKKYGHVVTSEYVLNRMVDFFDKHSIPNCRAGERMLVVNPDGTLSPCGLIITDCSTIGDLKEKFMRTNLCTNCYTSSRAASERPARFLLRDSLQLLYQRNSKT